MDGGLLEWSRTYILHSLKEWVMKRLKYGNITVNSALRFFSPLNRYRKWKETETDTAFLRRTHERSREVEPGSVGQRKEIKKKNNCTG